MDPKNVDIRRVEVRLGTLADYISHWNMTWDIEKNKKTTVKIDAEKEK